MNICIVQPWFRSASETFIEAHVERLPARVTAVHGRPPHIGDSPVLSNSLPARIVRALHLNLRRRFSEQSEYAYDLVLRRTGADAVLAEYGPAGVAMMKVCERRNLPLIAHFHGYDAYKHDILREHRNQYKMLFERAAAIVAVSREMKEQLASLGATPDKIFLNPCGVDASEFETSSQTQRHSFFLTVGRFVPKKAPHLVILAFAEVHRKHPHAELRMIGDGPLMEVCRDLASALGIGSNVRFLGRQPHSVVRSEMAKALAVVQHSVTADSGDREGTPVVVLEAGACGLPVVSTYHAGIPDVVVQGRTGLLVEERDVQGMAGHMLELFENPEHAGSLGAAARERILEHFTMDRSIGRLWSIIEGCVEGTAMPPLDVLPEATPKAAPRSAPTQTAFVV